MTHQWYLTFHGGAERSDINSIHAYDVGGRKIGKALDRRSLPANLELRELRGHVFGPDGDLYVANSFKDYSEIIRFHGRRDSKGKHAFREVFIQNDAIRNPGLSHPFNIVFDKHGDLFVSSQNTSVVLSYHGPGSVMGEPGTPRPMPVSLSGRTIAELYPGTFCASAMQVPHGLKVVRAGIFAGGRLYVADRDADCVRKFDPETGAYLGAISDKHLIDKPIHLIANGAQLYIGNRGNESVARCDLNSGQVAAFIRPKAGGLNNPSGMAFGSDGYFYVGSRGTRQVLRFSLKGAPERKPFIHNLEDEPEFIAEVGISG